MDPQPAPPEAPREARPASALTGGDAAARAEARVNMLGRLAQMAYDTVEEIREELRAAHLEKAAERAGESASEGAPEALADAPETPAKPPVRKRDIPELALAFARASRAARMACALQAALEPGKPADAPDALPTRVTVRFVDGATGEEIGCARSSAAAAASAAPYLSPSERRAAEAAEFRARKADALGVLGRVAKATLLPGELSPRGEAEAVERVLREATERLEREDDFAGLMRRPFSEIVDHICRDLGFLPDWPVLAEEDWAKAELAGETVGKPLAPFRPARREADPIPPRPPERWAPRKPPS